MNEEQKKLLIEGARLIQDMATNIDHPTDIGEHLAMISEIAGKLAEAVGTLKTDAAEEEPEA